MLGIVSSGVREAARAAFGADRRGPDKKGAGDGSSNAAGKG